MAKKREQKQEELMLIPFLDILCSLIGVLILIVVVVCVAQMQKLNARPKEDVARSELYQKLMRQMKELEKNTAPLKAKLSEAEKKELELAEKQKRLEELRKFLAQSENASVNKDKAAQIKKEIEALIVQIATVSTAIPPLQTEIASLKKLLADRKTDEKPHFTVARPYGSGTRQNQPLFFVEANGVGIEFHMDKTEKVRVTLGSVGTDKDYNAFLKTVKNTGNAMLIFLIRRDGWGSYLRAAGWAEQEFGLNTSKLPIPGDGVVDLSLFEKPVN